MASSIIVREGPLWRETELHKLVPSLTRLTIYDIGSHVESFRLENYQAAAGEFPAVRYTSHLAGVALPSGSPCRLHWKDEGIAKTDLLYPGGIFTGSVEAVNGFHWDQPINMLTLSIGPGAMEQLLPEPFSRPPIELLPIRSGPPDPVLAHLFEAIRKEAECTYLGGRLFLENLCHTTALYLTQRYAVFRPRLPPYKSGLSRERLSRVLEYIEANVSNSLSVGELAGVACLSPYHFGKMFRRSTGVTVHAYVTQKRLARAEHLLRSSMLSLSEVALASGFCDQSQMTAVFRRYAHIAPGAYRLRSK